MNRARAVLTALVLLSALGVAGCSDDPEPKFEPTPTEAPSSAATASAPTMPDAAKGASAAAAEAFVRFYWATINYAQATGDVTLLKTLGRQCENCDNSVQFIADVYEAGGQIVGGDGRVRDFSTAFVARNGDQWAVIECTLATEDQVVDRPGNQDDERIAAGDTDIRLFLEPQAGSWVVRSMVMR